MKIGQICKDNSFYKELLSLSLPLCAQNLLTFLLSVSDNVMIGRLGEGQNAGVFVGGQVQLLLQMLLSGIEGGVMIVATQYHGKKDIDGVRKVSVCGVYMCLFVSALLFGVSFLFPSVISRIFTKSPEIIDTGATYLSILSFSFIPFAITSSLVAACRSTQKAKIGFFSSLTALAVNVTLNYVLIYGKLGFKPYGVMGAAISTLVARIAEATVVLIYVFVIEKDLRLRIKHIVHFDKKAMRRYIKHGLPVLWGQVVWAFNTLSATAIMGMQSTEGTTAALAIATTLNNLSYVVTNGAANALSILIGKTVGEGKEDKIRQYSYTGQLIFLILGLISSLFLLVAQNPFVSLYSISDSTLRLTKELISILIFVSPFTAYQLGVITGLIKGAGDGTFLLKIDLFLIFLVVLPSALILTRLNFAPWAVFLSLKIDHLIKCIPATIKLKGRHFIKKTA